MALFVQAVAAGPFNGMREADMDQACVGGLGHDNANSRDHSHGADDLWTIL